jgi:hypothetical protein
MKPSTRLLLSRLAISLVFLWNIQCAFVFLLWPGRYAAAFELSGVPGEVVLQSVGILFMMWNIPYAVALWNPARYRISLYEATAMQTLGVIGEIVIWLGLPSGYTVLQASLLRFLAFDVIGLILLLLAIWIVRGYLRTL